MKKLLVITSLALTLTVNSAIYALAQENTTTQISENKELNESKFKSILTEPSNYFDFKVSEAKYVVKNTDTEYLLLAATSEEAKGLYNIKVFAFDKANNKVIELDDEFVLGKSATSWFSGSLEEYSNNSNKLRYTVKSESVDKFEIKDIIFENNQVIDETLKEGLLSKDKLPSANVKEITWKNLEISKVTPESGQSTSSSSSTSEKNGNNPTTEKKDVPQKQEIIIERKENKQSKFDINAIANGDLSSLAGGVYTDTYIKDNNSIGIMNKDVQLGIDSITKQGNTAIIKSSNKASQYTETGEYIVVDAAPVYHYVVPAGEKSPVEVENDDINKDRVITQFHANTYVNYVDSNNKEALPNR